MIKPINIYSKNICITLEKRRYRIYALGGFGVKLKGFSISFENTETDTVTVSKKAFWLVQTHAYNRRAKRIFIVDIPFTGEYKVKFHNSDALELKRSNLFLLKKIHSNIPNKNIDILISTSIGFNSYID